MKTPNSVGEIRPCLSNFKFYIGQTGQDVNWLFLVVSRWTKRWYDEVLLYIDVSRYLS